MSIGQLGQEISPYYNDNDLISEYECAKRG